MKDKDWSSDRQGAVENVFYSHRWGDSSRSGKTPKTGGYWKLQQEKKKANKSLKS